MEDQKGQEGDENGVAGEDHRHHVGVAVGEGQLVEDHGQGHAEEPRQGEGAQVLPRELGFLPKDELDDAIRYYDEYINDAGDDEEKVIAEMGTPHKVAEEFKNEYYDRKIVNDESDKTQ